MIQYKVGNVLEEDVEALVNSVNCVGVMGRGVALQFKKAFPENFKAYAAACKRGEVQPGRMFVYEAEQLGNPRFIINFPTKRHWRGKSSLADIEAGLDALMKEISARGIRSVALPPLGSGLGGLDWAEVRPRIEEVLADLPDIRVIVFEPSSIAEDAKPPRLTEAPKMTVARAAIVGLMNRYLAGLMDPFVTLLEVHKLMYFMQAAGEELSLKYEPAHYGPYAENLRLVLKKIEGHLISGYGDAGEEPGKQLELVPGAIEDADAFLAKHEATRDRFNRVTDLVEGFETSFGLELLSTVHWVATHGAATSQEVVAKTYEWGDRKRQFTEPQIRIALNVLSAKGWVSDTLSTDAVR